MSNYRKVTEFHQKFGIDGPRKPQNLTLSEQAFRLSCLQEELHEYEIAIENQDLTEQLDALVDLIYFAYGTAHRNGFDIDTAFHLVHKSNLMKELNGPGARRNYDGEITKPHDWVAPDLKALVEPSLAPYLRAGDFAGCKGLICIDGPDATGKTTLAERIVEVCDGELIHLTWSPEIEERMDTYRQGALDYASVAATEKVVVLERPWLSNAVYSNVYRGHEPHPAYDNWCETARDNQVCEILALPEDSQRWLDHYIEMTKTRKEMYADADHSLMLRAYWLFEVTLRDPEAGLRYDMHKVDSPAAMDNWITRNILPTITE